jgi:hypothetical protein
MSSQLEFLSNLIGSAQTGNDGAISLLRQICSSAAERAPAPDLIALAQFLYRLGIETEKNEASRN